MPDSELEPYVTVPVVFGEHGGIGLLVHRYCGAFVYDVEVHDRVCGRGGER